MWRQPGSRLADWTAGDPGPADFPYSGAGDPLSGGGCFFKEQKRADEIVQQRREEIETELPRFVNTVEQELRSSRDVLNILKAYQHNAGHAMKRELEITIADMPPATRKTP